MRLSLSVLTARVSPSLSQALPGRGLIALAAATLAGSLSAQTGSVSFAVDSLDEVNPIPAPYADFASKMYTYEFGSTGATPSILFLRNFATHFQAADTEVEDSVSVRTLVSEYIGLAYDSSGQLDSVTDNGLLALQIPITDTGETVTATGSGVAGFIRTTQNPSELPTIDASGPIDGFNGTMSWNFQAANRVVQINGSGFKYDPSFTISTFATLNHSSEIATIGGFDMAISSNSTEQWSFSQSLLSLDDDLTGTDSEFSFIGALQFDTLPSDESLPLIPDPDTIDPTSFQYGYYVLSVVDDSDFDGDGIPDFVDLSGLANPNALAKPNHASEQLDFSSWFYSPYFDAWFYSTEAAGKWDYSMTLGWIYDPTTGSVFDPDSFWLYIHTPQDNASEFGWVWTSKEVQPWYYRSIDDTWIELKSSTLGSQSTFYNLSTDAEETLNF